jgi:hypothetical protein
VQAFTHEGDTGILCRSDRKSYGSAKTRIGTRALMTVIVIFLTFTGIVGVLWIGARDVRAGVMTVGELVQFVIYAVMVAGLWVRCRKSGASAARGGGDGAAGGAFGRGGPGAWTRPAPWRCPARCAAILPLRM